MSKRSKLNHDRIISIAGLSLSVIATLIACLAWYGESRNESALEEIKVEQLLDDAQDLIGEAALNLRPVLCTRPSEGKSSLEEARRRINEALRYQKLPKNYRAYFLLALVHAYRGDPTGALKIIDEALESVPDEHMLYAARGTILMRLGKLQDSATALEYALKLSPENIGYQSSLGYILYKLGETERAQQLLEKALQRDNSFVPAHINLGDLLRAQGTLDQALSHFQRAVLLAPKDADAHGNAGYTYAIKGDLEQAVIELQTAIDLAPNCGQYFYNMGLVQRRLGNTKAENQFIERAKQLGINVP